jgi:hypothetical protein
MQPSEKNNSESKLCAIAKRWFSFLAISTKLRTDNRSFLILCLPEKTCTLLEKNQSGQIF